MVSGELRRFNELRDRLGLPPVRKLDDQFGKNQTGSSPSPPNHTSTPAQRLATAGAARGTGPVGAARRPSHLAGGRDAADRARNRVDRVPARREADRHRTRRARRREHRRRRDHRGPRPSSVPCAPPNARVEQFLPHNPILARATCVVCHGGQGITQKALAAGVPVCVVPFSRDQFDVARRVQINDAGVRLHHRRLNPERLRAAVNKTVTKRVGAERIARAFADAGGKSAAADAVEELTGAVSKP